MSLNSPPTDDEWLIARTKKNIAMHRTADELWTVAEELWKKWRIKFDEELGVDRGYWAFSLFVPILVKKLNVPLETLMQYAVYHYLTMSTPLAENELDMPGGAIQKCAEKLLEELKKENASTNTGVLEF